MKKSKMVLTGSVEMEILRNSKVFFLFAREVFSSKAMFSYQNGYIYITYKFTFICKHINLFYSFNK